MSMLERAAAGLEPSRLQRLLPKTPKSVETPASLLHTSARQNGPAGDDVLLACRSLVSGTSRRDGYFDMFMPELFHLEPLNASAFLLDFLYPNGALKYIRRLASYGTNRNIGRVDLLGTLIRNHRQSTQPYSSLPKASSSTTPSAHVDDAHAFASTTDVAAGLASSSATGPTAQTSSVTSTAAQDELQRLLRADTADCGADAYERVWALYERLESCPEDGHLGRRVLAFIAPSERIIDARRVLRLFDELNESQWDAASVQAAVKSHLTLHNPDGALSVFQRSLSTEAWADNAAPGFDYLVASALESSNWDRVLELWDLYKGKTERNKAEPSLLTAVLDLPDLYAKLLEFHEHNGAVAGDVAQAGPDGADGRLVSLKEMYKAVLEASLHHLDPDLTFPLVRALDNPRVFENFIVIAINSKRTNLAARAYAAYRTVQGCKPHVSTLSLMLSKVYYPDNVRGMEDLLKDWHNAKGRLNRWAYQKYLAFYASRGDVKSVYRLWNEFTEAYPDAIANGQDTFAHLLKVHAVRGYLPQVNQAFFEIHDKYGVEPNIICWNIRLHSYVEKGDYTKAMGVFEDLCEAVKPDDYSFGTIMSLVGRRGDLPLVADLYRLAQQCGVRMTESIVDALVEAYCQNDLFDEAEQLCAKTTREKKVAGQPYTALWNTLLHHHAFRHDLVAVNRILNVMTRLNVAYDGSTYSALLLALAQCRQPRRAVELLRAAQEDGIFKPTAQHYTLLMMAYIRSKQPHRALQVNRLMHHMGFPKSSEQIQLVIKAFSQWQDYPSADRMEGGATSTERRDLFAKALREFQRSLAASERDPIMSTRTPVTGRDAVRMHLGAVRRFSFIIFMLVQALDFAGVEEVMQLYQSVAPPEERNQPLPLKLCNALLLADFNEGHYDRVKAMWQTILDRAREVSQPLSLQDTRLEAILGQVDRPSDDSAAPEAGRLESIPEESPRVVAKLRYGLSDALKTMQRLYVGERDADGLIRLVNEDVLGNGFLLDNKNWNHYVQNLARLGRIREAFSVCEEHLMTNWSGFATLRGRYQRYGAGPAPDQDQGDELPGEGFVDDDVLATVGVRPRVDMSGGDGDGGDGAAGADGIGHSAYPKKATLHARLQRLLESATRYNRPTTYTVMVLAKAYLELEQMAVWSSAGERQFQELAIKCPKSVHAVRTMVRMNSRIEGRVFGDDGDMRGGLRGGLREPMGTGHGDAA